MREERQLDSEIIARPLVTITNVIWSFNTELHDHNYYWLSGQMNL